MTPVLFVSYFCPSALHSLLFSSTYKNNENNNVVLDISINVQMHLLVVSMHAACFVVYLIVTCWRWCLYFTHAPIYPLKSRRQESFCSIICGRTACLLYQGSLSVSIQHAAVAGNVLWAVISASVSVRSENKWDLWCQPEWHRRHEK